MRKFVKKKPTVDARGFPLSDDEKDVNEKKYINTLEGKALTEYVDRYTHKKADHDYQRFLQEKQEVKAA